MPKKSKPAETEALSGDIPDLLWTHVINPDPGGAWLDDALKNAASAPEPLKTALPAIQRLLATKASREDLGRVARQERYGSEGRVACEAVEGNGEGVSVGDRVVIENEYCIGRRTSDREVEGFDADVSFQCSNSN